ncbi:ribosomal protein S18-alanine N-acetyltransferase [bacterium]|nr:ribosomal protein S18-alanine N-acetyltransferase [bacterium]
MTAPAAPVVIRRSRPEDLGAVLRIEHLSFSDPWTADALYGELGADALRLSLVAERAGQVCGYLMAWLVVDQLHVLNIAIDPDARRLGLGTALLAEAARRAEPLGMVDVTLEVRRSNTGARQFYRRHGLREVGLRPGYYGDNGEDAIIMTGPLSDLAALSGPAPAGAGAEGENPD